MADADAPEAEGTPPAATPPASVPAKKKISPAMAAKLAAKKAAMAKKSPTPTAEGDAAPAAPAADATGDGAAAAAAGAEGGEEGGGKAPAAVPAKKTLSPAMAAKLAAKKAALAAKKSPTPKPEGEGEAGAGDGAAAAAAAAPAEGAADAKGPAAVPGKKSPSKKAIAKPGTKPGTKPSPVKKPEEEAAAAAAKKAEEEKKKKEEEEKKKKEEEEAAAKKKQAEAEEAAELARRKAEEEAVAAAMPGKGDDIKPPEQMQFQLDKNGKPLLDKDGKPIPLVAAGADAAKAEDQLGAAEAAKKAADAAAKNAGQPRAKKRPVVDTASRKQMGPLTVDPRSGLPLIEFPRDRQHSFAHLGTDLVLHLFMDVDRITSKGNPKRRTLFVTDQTLFVCEEEGGVSRSIPVSSIMQVNVAQDSSNGLAFVVPTEYDLVIKPDRKQQRDDLLVVLRAVFRRMTNSELNVHYVKEIKANQYRMNKPQGFQLQTIPQRTRAHLQQALEAMEQEELDRAQAIQSVQSQLETEHRGEVETKMAELQAVQQRLDKAQTRLREQTEELEALRSQYGKTKKRVEEIEQQMNNSGGAGAETLQSKEGRIRELQDVVDSLTQTVAKANEERHRVEQLRRRGDFEEFDMDHVDADSTRFRGRSLHQQGLVEVLQRQLLAKRKHLNEFQNRQTDTQRLNLELARKEEVLRDYEQLVPSKSRESDPMLLYSDLPGTGVEDMLDRRNNVGPPGRIGGGGPTGAAADPVLGLASTVGRHELQLDEDGDEAHTGIVPQHKVHVSSDLPEYKLPDDERDFNVDPRTQLKFIDIPLMFQEAFKELAGTILHFFAVASKSNKRGREQKRIIMVSDRVLYQCNTAGHINRCVPVIQIREMQIDNQFNVALIIDGRNEYDMAFRFETMSNCDEMANVIKRTTTFLRRVPPVKITHVERLLQSDLRLEKPPAWEFRLHPLAPRKALFKALQELSQSTAEQRARIHEQADQQTLELINRLKEEMRPEITMRREREFSVLRQQLIILDNSLREKQNEARQLRRRIADHRCNVDVLKLSNRGALAAEATETPGMYWIPSDPVIMECQLDILHIAFHDNFVVTSHANGVLNVWDLTTADLFRTLKANSHTARVQAFHFDAHVLISGGFDGSLRQWSIVEGVCSKAIPQAHRGHITCLKFDHQYLITGGSDAVAHVWDVSSLKQLKTLQGHKSGVTALSFQRNTLATAEWGWIFTWDIEKGLVQKVLRDDNGGICTLDIQGSTIVTGGSGGVLIVWNLHTNEGEQLEGHSDDIHCVQLQSQFAISSSADGTIRMWNAKDRTSLGVFHNCAPSECKTFCFKANRFVIAEGRTIKAWTR